ncbi:PTS glucitol/sorbitol transporter subunit IIA [Enterococcus mundtii]|uniref:PTS glucitol/sorbitol transporter subunit IIA n=1 Tax=Enterococcus mundtii TaxID=53346 RepID=UPI0035BF25ED
MSKPENVLRKNGALTIGQNKYRILEVGSEANANYESLGHISIYFRETENNEILPGAILVEPKVFPTLGLGDEITIE